MQVQIPLSIACENDEAEALRLLNELLLPALNEAADTTLAEAIPTAMIRSDDETCQVYNQNTNKRRLLQADTITAVVDMILSPKYGVDDIVLTGNIGLYMRGIRVLSVEDTNNVNSTSIEKGLGWGPNGVLEPIKSPPIQLAPRTPDENRSSFFYILLVVLVTGAIVLVYSVAIVAYIILHILLSLDAPIVYPLWAAPWVPGGRLVFRNYIP